MRNKRFLVIASSFALSAAIVCGLAGMLILFYGCTTAHYKDADRSAWAVSILQKRALELDHSTPTSGTLKVNYDSTGDSATASALVEAAVKAAIAGATK